MFCFVSIHFTPWKAVTLYSLVFKMKEQRRQSAGLCEWSPGSPTWRFLLSGLCTGASRRTPEAHWWTRGAACGLTRVVRMWTRWADWSAMGLRIFVLGDGADWSYWARLERSGARDWLRKCFSGNLWKGERTLWMKKERKVLFFPKWVIRGRKLSGAEATVQQQHFLPPKCLPPQLQRRAVARWPSGWEGSALCVCTAPGVTWQPLSPLEQHRPTSRRYCPRGLGTWLGLSGAVSTTAFLLFGGFCCHHLPQSLSILQRYSLKVSSKATLLNEALLLEDSLIETLDCALLC